MLVIGTQILMMVVCYRYNYTSTAIANCAAILLEVADNLENEESVRVRLAEHDMTDFSPFTSTASALLYMMLHSPRPMV